MSRGYHNNYHGGYRNNNYHHNYHHNNNYRPQPQRIQYVPVQQPAQEVNPWKGIGARIVEGSIISAVGYVIQSLAGGVANAMDKQTDAKIAQMQAEAPVKPKYHKGSDGKYYDDYGNMIVPPSEQNK